MHATKTKGGLTVTGMHLGKPTHALFTPTARVVGRMAPAEAREIEQEVMLYNYDAETTWPRRRGHLTMRFVQTLIELEEIDGSEHISLDTRSHMLMDGWWPAIPGWHQDDVDRGEDGQPDYINGFHPERRMYLVCLDASDAPTLSMTQFLSDRWHLPITTNDEHPTIYGRWDKYINGGLNDCYSPIWTPRSGEIVRFGPADIHRAMPAQATGWRWFARLIVNPGPRASGPKIRQQVQVYLDDPSKGW